MPAFARLRPMAYLKKDAPADVIETLRQAEAQADECWRELQIRYYPTNVAIWALLTGGIKAVEHEQAARRSNTPHFGPMMINVSRSLAVAVKWAMRYGQPVEAPLNRRWTGELSAAAEQALSVAKDYSHVEVCFQGFHKNLYAADVLGPALVRFTAPGVERDRQVSAYQKGLRPREGRFAGQPPEPRPQSPRVREAFEAVLRSCRQTGSLGFECGDPWDLWRELLPEYRERVNALARRAESLSLGDYRLDEFNAFYAALIAACGAQEFLCYRWGQVAGAYPLESAAMVRAAAEWVDVLSRLSGIPPEKCRAMLSDLSFSDRSIDLHVHPLVPLDGRSEVLALAPPFPLHSRHDENILRVCSQRRSEVYDVTSLEKEAEMRAALQTAGARYGADRPVKLPDPLPDIDLLMADEPSSTLVIAELKWLRKTLRPAEIPDRDAELLKGIDQLSSIQRFLAEAPAHLAALGRLPKAVNEYDHVHYLLVARDYWRWVEPQDRIAIVEFDVIVRALERSDNLHAIVSDLLTYGWLPVEGRDFRVQFDGATANGVAIESQVFYSTAPA